LRQAFVDNRQHLVAFLDAQHFLEPSRAGGATLHNRKWRIEQIFIGEVLRDLGAGKLVPRGRPVVELSPAFMHLVPFINPWTVHAGFQIHGCRDAIPQG
jgi:hypothetical protein